MKPALLLGFCLALALAGVALGQDAETEVADVPSGSGTIRGRLVHPAGVGKSAGLSVIVYSLGSNGTPGLRQGRSDERGAFRFEEISTDPGTTYLIGTRYEQIPFGARVSFSPGESEVELEIAISDPITGGADIEVTHSEIRFDLVGSEILVSELHQIQNHGDQVVYANPSQRKSQRPVFLGALLDGARGLLPAQGLFREGLDPRGDELWYWGPLYPGDQEIRYQYRLGPEAGVGEGEEWQLALKGRLPSGSNHVLVLSADNGLQVSLEGFRSGSPVEREGRRFRVLEANDLAAGFALDGVVRIPAGRNDPSALGLTRVDLWLELDAAALTVSQQVELRVEDADRLMGSSQSPLLHFELPPGAELLGLTSSARELGAFVSPGGGIDLLGPLAGGGAGFGMRYRLPVREGVGQIDVRFPKPLPLLNVLIADTGVIIEDSRLHRKRPVRSGTRTYLHREGFQIDARETVSLRLRPLSRRTLPRWASLALLLLPGAGAIAFLFGPLRPRPDGASPGERLSTSVSREREGVYTAIRDLDLDYDTAKIADGDYQKTRAELRARAIELLRQEQTEEKARAERSARAANGDGDVSAACPACGQGISAPWRFCARCGAALPGVGGAESPEKQGG